MIDVIVELSEYNDLEIIGKHKLVSTIDEKKLRQRVEILREEAINQLKDVKCIESQSPLKDQVMPDSIPISEGDIWLSNADIKHIMDVAVEAVYGYRDGFCEKTCSQRDLMIQKFGEDLFLDPDRPKCYECYQTSFIHMMSMIAEGQPYSQIPGLMYFLNNSMDYIKRYLQVVAPDKLEEVVVFRAEDPLFYGEIAGAPPEIYKNVFHNHLYGLIAGDLNEFLLHNERRKLLNKCQLRGEYFIAKKADPRIKYCPTCSTKCKMTREQTKEYDEERAKRQKSRKEAERAKRKEIEIEDLMKSLDSTKEEAIELWEEEKGMSTD